MVTFDCMELLCGTVDRHVERLWVMLRG